MAYLKNLVLINLIELVIMKLTTYMSERTSLLVIFFNNSHILMIVFEHYDTSTSFTVTLNFSLCDRGRRLPLCLCICGYGGSQVPVKCGCLSVHSSIGLAKSSLESINGVNLFGEQGTSSSVIYVDIDAHNRNRTIFESILPRESNSKVCWHESKLR